MGGAKLEKYRPKKSGAFAPLCFALPSA